MAIDALKLEAQQVLDELMKEQLIPFKLYAGEVVSEGVGKYTIRFHDSRIRSVTVTLEAGQCFKDSVRTATLARVARMSGPLSNKKR
ncbi:MAG: hypothetical protein H7Z38_18980 [Rubrivivax sp.]|nr:hypothetical protein [Pyrinomonadaceae bacterium]